MSGKAKQANHKEVMIVQGTSYFEIGLTNSYIIIVNMLPRERKRYKMVKL
jgi:hypothetical protein